MSNKQFRMKPKLWLQLGPYQHREARLGPLTWTDLHQLLHYRTPFEAEQAAREQKSERAQDLFSEALYDWNSTFSEDENESYHSTKGWKWTGIAMRGEADGCRVWMSVTDNFLSVDLDQAQLEGEARRCALAAHEALLPLIKPTSSR